MTNPTLAVVVPTFRRPAALAACLEALGRQHRPPDEVVVVTRVDDPEAVATVRASALRCRLLELDATGVLAAMAAGAHATTSEVVCFTDDDAVPPATWLEGIAEAMAASPRLGGVGGRDVLVDDGVQRVEPLTADVGRVTWYGRHVGNHHRGTGAARDVAFLKGVNSAYRRAALGLPNGLRGSGAQAHFEVAAGRFARTRGYRLVYDPALVVEHHPATRQGEDQRAAPTPGAVADAAYNLVVAIGGLRGLCRVAYATVVGDRGAPGLVRGIVALARGDAETARRLVPAARGTFAGGWTLVRGRELTYDTFL